MSDQLTPVVAYQRLVGDDRYAPSFLFESVQNGTDSGRFSFVGAWPDLEILAKGNDVTVLDHCKVWCTSTPVALPTSMLKREYCVAFRLVVRTLQPVLLDCLCNPTFLAFQNRLASS